MTGALNDATNNMTSSGKVLHWVTISAPTNIAVIKYWGKANSQWNTPINDSLSVTLDHWNDDSLRAVTTVAMSPEFSSDRLWLNGKEDGQASTNARFRACIDGVKNMAITSKTPIKLNDGSLLDVEELKTMHFHVSSYNTFPTAAGLASSAAGYAALVAAMAALLQVTDQSPGAFEGQLSTIARQGSGSACRSLYGGFVAWRRGGASLPDDHLSKGGSESDWHDSRAQQVASEQHWPDLRALILVVSDLQKDTSSTNGMLTSVQTSSLLQHRAQTVVPERMKQMEQAIAEKDFTSFAKLTMQDSNQFHATCLDTYPPIFYMNDTSRTIIRIVTLYNEFYATTNPETLRAAYTFDAGPNAVLYVPEVHVVELAALMLHYFGEKAMVQQWVQQKPEFATKIAAFTLDSNLLQACDKAFGRSGNPKSHVGNVKCMYYTQPGPGPKVLENECNLDLNTGLNTFVPSKK